MDLNLEGLELSDDIIAKLKEQTAGMMSAAEVEGLKNNRDDLLAEKEERIKAKNTAETQLEEARIQSLRDKKDFESLYSSAETKLAEYEQRDKDNALKIQQQAVSSKAVEMAKTISDGDNADLLASFIEKRLRSEGGEIKVTDANGNLTISTQEDLLNEFKANQRYAALVTVTKADGGRATTATKLNGSAIVDKTNPEAVRKSGIEQRLHAAGIQTKQ